MNLFNSKIEKMGPLGEAFMKVLTWRGTDMWRHATIVENAI